MRLTRPASPTPLQVVGQEAEDNALVYLQKQGLDLLCQNYHCKMGELDLVMKDKMHIVFIEVRSRKDTRFGGALASITPSKQKKIIRAAQHYMMYHRIYEQYPMRFDVILFDGQNTKPNWIKNAFTAGGF